MYVIQFRFASGDTSFFPKEYNIVARLADILCDLPTTEAGLQSDTDESKQMASYIDRFLCAKRL
jgi:hypothetical protein